MAHDPVNIRGLLVSKKEATKRVRSLGSPVKLAPLMPRVIKTRGKRFSGWDAKGWVTGAKKGLRISQAYPRAFAQEMAAAIMQSSRQ